MPRGRCAASTLRDAAVTVPETSAEGPAFDSGFLSPEPVEEAHRVAGGCSIRFEEEQRISMWWVWLAVLVPAAIMGNIFVQQILCGRPHGEHPGPDWLLWLLTVFLCVCVPVLLLILRLTVVVDDDGVHIRFHPLVRRTIPLGEIRSFRARRYRPIREFGGWGIRSGLGKKSAYNAKGDLGVELYLRDMHSIMIGSQRHTELAEALRRHGVTEEAAP